MASLIGDVLLIGYSGPLPPPPPQAVRIQAAKSAAHTGKNFILWLPFVCTPTGRVPGRCNQKRMSEKIPHIHRDRRARPISFTVIVVRGRPDRTGAFLIAGPRLSGEGPVSTRKGLDSGTGIVRDLGISKNTVLDIVTHHRKDP